MVLYQQDKYTTDFRISTCLVSFCTKGPTGAEISKLLYLRAGTFLLLWCLFTSGNLCDICLDGHYGDPKGWYGLERPCERCECNDNIDTNAVGNCNR